MRALVEVTLSWLFKNAKGRDEKSFYRSPAFARLPKPTVDMTSPECGATPAQLHKELTADGAGKFPSLAWRAPDDIASRVEEWLLVVEDPDAPLATPIPHGVYVGIPVSKTGMEQADLDIVDDSKGLLKGGFHYGKTRRPVVYLPPRPLMNHGPHRYFFQIVALSKALSKELVVSKPSVHDVAEAINGNVLGWGLWIGSYERKWE